MKLKKMLASVRNDLVKFVTVQPPNSPFTSLERHVVVTGPPELVALSKTPRVLVLDALVQMLKEPNRNWAAMVVLAAMTRREDKIVDAFANSPDEWQASVGRDAYHRWARWLEMDRASLRWDSETETFVSSKGA